MNGAPPDAIVWRTPAGAPVSCVEKIKVMSQNFRELQQVMQDALEDAVLMGCDEGQVRGEIARLAACLETSFRKL
jgi:hypothetical protein